MIKITGKFCLVNKYRLIINNLQKVIFNTFLVVKEMKIFIFAFSVQGTFTLLTAKMQKLLYVQHPKSC